MLEVTRVPNDVDIKLLTVIIGQGSADIGDNPDGTGYREGVGQTLGCVRHGLPADVFEDAD
jgi:hypothetical protein